MFFSTVPSANTLVRWVNENAFASIVPARPCPTFGRPVHLRGSPHRLRPGSSPHALRIPSRDGHPALRRITPSADDALPPSLDIAPLIRVPEGLQPSRTTRCSAHTTPAADFCCGISVNYSTLSHESETCSRSPVNKFDCFRYATAEFTTSVLDGYGLRCQLPTRPTP